MTDRKNSNTRSMSIVDRLAHHTKINAETGCHEWTGALVYGYGTVTNEGVQYRAHRVSYEVANGPIPDGLYVLHRCDNRACINPQHLFLGTHQENMEDMTAKERQVRGVNHALAKLDDDKVRAIRTDLRSDEAVAADFGVDHSLIHRVRMRRSWKHVPETPAELEAITTRKANHEKNKAKLTEEQVRSIRSDARSGPVLAKEYGVDKALINRIRQRKAWTHVL